MVGVGAGLANGGLLPFVCGAACFLTGRSLEQIKADIAYSNANVKLVGISSGGTLAAIAQKLPELPAGARVLGFNYDTGERYLSVPDFLPVA